jgi:hypothetical protein
MRYRVARASLVAVLLVTGMLGSASVTFAKTPTGVYALDLILRDPGVGGLNGGKFQLSDRTGRTVGVFTTATVGGAPGTICVDSLPAGTYTWTEIKPPKGFVPSGTVPNGQVTQSVTTVSTPGSCTSGTGGFAVTIFDNVPK